MASGRPFEAPSEAWPASWPLKAQNSHIFDPRGDVLLVIPELSIATVEESPSPGSISQRSVATISEAISPDVNELPVVHLRVSSKHLCLASSVFKRMLESDYKEAMVLREQGSVVIELPDDNSTAMIQMMHIIHGKPGAVKRSVELPALVEYAILVDKWDLLEVTQLFSELWIFELENIGRICPTRFPHDIVAWMMISWVFRSSKIFKYVTRYMITHYSAESQALIDDRYPIPSSILDEIARKRDAAIAQICSTVQNLIRDCTGPAPQCPSTSWTQEQRVACDATVLGSMVKGFSGAGVWPTVADPSKIILNTLMYGMQRVNIVDACGTFNIDNASQTRAAPSPSPSQSRARIGSGSFSASPARSTPGFGSAARNNAIHGSHGRRPTSPTRPPSFSNSPQARTNTYSSIFGHSLRPSSPGYKVRSNLHKNNETLAQAMHDIFKEIKGLDVDSFRRLSPLRELPR